MACGAWACREPRLFPHTRDPSLPRAALVPAIREKKPPLSVSPPSLLTSEGSHRPRVYGGRLPAASTPPLGIPTPSHPVGRESHSRPRQGLATRAGAHRIHVCPEPCGRPRAEHRTALPPRDPRKPPHRGLSGSRDRWPGELRRPVTLNPESATNNFRMSTPQYHSGHTFFFF